MTEKTLEVYSLRINKYGDKDIYTTLSDIEGRDLFDTIFSGFPNFVDELPPDEDNKTNIQFTKKKIDSKNKTVFEKLTNKRLLYGKVSTGQYGKVEDVIDVTDKEKEPVFQLTHNQSVVKPFFFLFFLPQNKDTGFLVLEREGQHGIKVLFTEIIRKFVNQQFDKHYTSFDNVIDDQLIRNYVDNGEMHSITLTRHSLPGDIADKYGLGAHDTDKFQIELKITAKGRSIIPTSARRRILSIMDKNPEGFFTDKSFDKIGFSEQAEIKVKSKYNRALRTIDLSNTMKFRPYYIVDVKVDASGHSNLESIKEEAVKLLGELNVQI